MKESSVDVVLSKALFETKEFICGHILLKTAVPLNLHKIVLTLTKRQKINVCKLVNEGQTENSAKFYDDKVIYQQNYNLYVSSDLTEEISSGGHIFPFGIALKTKDNSSTEIKGIYFDHLVDIKNKYVLNGSVYLVGVYKPFLTVEKELSIIQTVDIETNFNFKIEMSMFMCLFYKTYTLYFKLNKPFYYSGDNLELLIDAERFKPKIKNIECNLYEILSVSVPQTNIIRTRYIIGGEALKSEKRSSFLLNLRIPSSAPSTVEEDTFSLKSVLYINVLLCNSNTVKLKKYIYLVRKNLEIPNFDCLNVLEGEVFEEKIFVLS